MLTHQNRNVKIAGVLLLGSCILFYLVFFWLDGVQLCKDSPGYINMDISREPLYPFFLALNRWIFGEKLYLSIVVIWQSILAGYAMWKLSDLTFRYSPSKMLLPALTVFFQVVVALLNRLAAMRQSIYANEIATEGLTFSLFTLFFIQVFLYFKEYRAKNLTALLVLAAIMVGVRKQMLIAYGIFFLTSLLYFIFRRYTLKKLGFLVCLLLLSFVSTKAIETVYYFALEGKMVERTRDSSYLLVISMYTAKETDDMILEDAEASELFRSMMDQIREQKLNLDDAEKGWNRLALHYGNSYDAISYGVAYPTIDTYVSEMYGLEGVEAGRMFDELSKRISGKLIPENAGRILKVFSANALMGFVNTVANMKSVLPFYALVVYLAFIVLLAVLYRRRRDSEAILAAELTIMSIIANVGAVTITIFSQPRYMIYNMPIFYMAFAWMVLEVLYCYQKRENGALLVNGNKKAAAQKSGLHG